MERDAQPRQLNAGDGYNADDLSDMLEELRVLLPSAQLLTTFLVTLPFRASPRSYISRSGSL